MASMLSLATNPYNPFTQYDLWKQFDRREGFDTDGFLARAIATSSELSDAEQDQDEEDAIDSILKNPSFEGLYVRVSSDT